MLSNKIPQLLFFGRSQVKHFATVAAKKTLPLYQEIAKRYGLDPTLTSRIEEEARAHARDHEVYQIENPFRSLKSFDEWHGYLLRKHSLKYAVIRDVGEKHCIFGLERLPLEDFNGLGTWGHDSDVLFEKSHFLRHRSHPAHELKLRRDLFTGLLLRAQLNSFLLNGVLPGRREERRLVESSDGRLWDLLERLDEAELTPAKYQLSDSIIAAAFAHYANKYHEYSRGGFEAYLHTHKNIVDRLASYGLVVADDRMSMNEVKSFDGQLLLKGLEEGRLLPYSQDELFNMVREFIAPRPAVLQTKIDYAPGM